MKFHKELTREHWEKYSFLEKMGNIGSEVSRTIRWKNKGKKKHLEKAFFRSLELFDYTITGNITSTQRYELCRAREVWCDYIYADNQYGSSDKSWIKYFDFFVFALRKEQENRGSS
ncbi:MAG: hypothetical protein ACOCXP_01910 [Candidatus Dojkabacteria bacterium]